MGLIVKEQVSEVVIDDPKTYYIYTTEVVKDVNDVEVTIPKLVGRFTLEQLNNEKNHLTARLAQIDEQIAAIENVK